MSSAKCSSATSSKTATDESELQMEFATESGATLGISGFEEFTGSFRASTEFKNNSKTMNKGEKGSAMATASCITHTYSIKKVLPPCMSAELMTFVDLLLESPGDEDVMNEMLDTFGTHSILSVEMGDKFVAKSTFKNDDYIKNKMNGGHIEFSAEMGFFSLV